MKSVRMFQYCLPKLDIPTNRFRQEMAGEFLEIHDFLQSMQSMQFLHHKQMHLHLRKFAKSRLNPTAQNIFTQINYFALQIFNGFANSLYCQADIQHGYKNIPC